MNFDDNAVYRRPEILELRDYNEEDQLKLRLMSMISHILNLMDR